MTVDFKASPAIEPPKPAVPELPPVAVSQPVASPGERPLDKLLITLVNMGGSDLHLSSGVKPMMRLHGEMTPVPGVELTLTSEHILLMCDEIAPAHNRREFRETNDTDFAYEIPGVARFRVNVFRHRRGAGAVFRQIPHRTLSLEELGLPDCVKSLCMLTKGLVWVTGPTGSGKSTTLAAMVDFINENRADHIITIEDPIEFVHESGASLTKGRSFRTLNLLKRRCALPCGKTLILSWWGSCEIWRPWPSLSRPQKPDIWFLEPSTPPRRFPRWTESLTSSPRIGNSRSA